MKCKKNDYKYDKEIQYYEKNVDTFKINSF